MVDPSSPTGTGTTRGEYVYGPDYVDEFVLQSYSLGSGEGDRQAKMYMLQDANYNVMALVDAAGGVLEQYQWDPYGTLVSKQTTASPAPVNRVGHQGLFFYRFDGSTGGPITTTATGLYYNRDRWYSPILGRFMQRDPNETALLTMAAGVNSESDSITLKRFDPAGYFGDGMNLNEYLGSNPAQRLDPLGQKWFRLGILGGIAVTTPAYLGGCWLGATYAAASWHGPKPKLISWSGAAVAATGAGITVAFSQPLLNAGVAAVSRSVSRSQRLLWEAIDTEQRASSAVGNHIVKQTIVFLSGMATSELAYTMWFLFER